MASEVINSAAELVAAREAQGVSREDMQRQLKIHINQLQALESGQWEALPGLPFVRGVLRGYGRALNIDVEPLLASIGGQNVATDLKAAAPLEEPIRSSGLLGFGNGGGGASWAWLGLMAVGVAALALFFGKNGEPGGGRAPAGIESKDSSSKDKTTAASKPAAESPAGHQLELGLSKDGGFTEKLIVKITPDPGSGTASAIAVKLTFLADSWVVLTQADGRTLLQGAQKAEAVSELLVKGAVTLTTAHPAKVKFEYDGKPVPLEFKGGAESLKSRLP